MKWVAIVWFSINVITYVNYGVDKRRARKGQWRISEITLLGLTFCGGAIGAWRAMKDYRHKTSKLRFKFLVPVALIVQVFTFGWIIVNNIEKIQSSILLVIVTVVVHVVFFLLVRKK